MQRGLLLALVSLLVGGIAVWSARAGDAPGVDDRLADIERRLDRIEAHLFGTGGEGTEDALVWTSLRDVADLRDRIAKAAASNTPVVVATWAEWSAYDEAYRRLIAEDPELRSKFAALVRLAIDVTHDPRHDLRRETGLRKGQPLMAFYDAAGRRVDEAAIIGWKKDDAKAALRASLARILPE